MSAVEIHPLVVPTHDALVAHTSEFCGLPNGGLLYRDKHMAVTVGPSGIAETTCNAFRTDPDFDAGKFLTKAQGIFDRLGLRFAALLRDEVDADIDIVADNLGMTYLSSPMPRMIAMQEVDLSADFHVQRVTTEDQLEQWFEIVGGAFGTEYPAAALRMDTLPPARMLEHRNITMLLVSIDSTPVTGGMVYSHGHTSYISNVGTLSEFRRQGAASALVRYATNAGLRNGADCSFLFASHGAERIWERVGYEAISYIHHRVSV